MARTPYAGNPLIPVNDVFKKSKFRGGLTARQGLIPAREIRGKIIDVNLNNWTVDFRSTYERMTYLDVAVASPYLHYNQGEGFSVMPDIGAVCHLVLPSDSSAPFVKDFIMPVEKIDPSTEETPLGTRSQTGTPENVVDASFGGGRPRAKPGDIMIRGRDGNFFILHRGGVLQIGATPLAQRIFIPLTNLIMDVAENYHLHTTGGSLCWGVQEGPLLERSPTSYVQTFRVHANDKYADVRVSFGGLQQLGEPAGDSGETQDLAGLSIGENEKEGREIVCEVVVAPGGFNASDGSPVSKDTRDASVFRYFFDNKGGVFLRSEANVLLSVRKKLKIKAEEIELITQKALSVLAGTGLDLNGGPYAHLKGDVIRLGQGLLPLARQGDIVQIMIPTAIVQGLMAGVPFSGVITILTPATGTIISGNGNLLG